jgi:hypothetical protein
MSAVDGALCATPAGRDNPVFPDDAAQQLRDLALEPEARALARYLLVEDALPDGVQAALDAMLWKNHAFSPGGQGWSVAALAALAHPDNARFAQDLVLEQGTLGRWRDLPAAGAAAVRHPELCERRAAVDHLARLAPELPLTRALERYLAALPAGTPADLDGLRYSVVAAERDAEAQTLTVELQVTNSAAVAAPVSLGGARLAGIDRPPAVDPDLPTIAPNSYRAVRLAFAGFRDELAEAAVLALRPGVELQAYSEVLR